MKTKKTKIKGFLSFEMAHRTATNIQYQIDDETYYGKNFTKVEIVVGKPIDSYDGMLPRWNVVMTNKSKPKFNWDTISFKSGIPFVKDEDGNLVEVAKNSFSWCTDDLKGRAYYHRNENGNFYTSVDAVNWTPKNK